MVFYAESVCSYTSNTYYIVRQCFIYTENPITLHETQVLWKILLPMQVQHKKKNQQRDRYKAWRDSPTPEHREKINASRRAARQNKTMQERNASQSTSRKFLTEEERQEMDARRRAGRKNKPDEQRQEVNSHRRARRQSIPPEERLALRAQCNVDLAARRKILCRESIAMPRPDAHLF